MQHFAFGGFFTGVTPSANAWCLKEKKLSAIKGTEDPIVLVHACPAPPWWKPAGCQQLPPPRLARLVPAGMLPPVPCLSYPSVVSFPVSPVLPLLLADSGWGSLPAWGHRGTGTRGCAGPARPGSALPWRDTGNIIIYFCPFLERGSFKDVLTKFFKSTSCESALRQELIIFSEVE